MAEEKKTVKKTAAKPAGAKAASGSAAQSAAPKAAAAKMAAPKGSAAKASAKKSSSAVGGMITVKQTGSAARSEEWAYQTLMGLGLGKINRVRTLEDTPAVRGMIARVHHLVTVQDAA